MDQRENQEIDRLCRRWGLPLEAVKGLGERLHGLWLRFKACFRSRTRDTSQLAEVYLQGLLVMEEKRNYANMARRIIGPEADGQNLQQFVSDSPWEAQGVFRQIQEEIATRPGLEDGFLTLDESGDERDGDKSAGAARQYLPRLGKIEMGQMGVCLSYSKDGLWAMVDAEIYLPQEWFDETHRKLHKKLHIPPGRTFMTKQALGLEMIRRAKSNGLPFRVVMGDCSYGKDPHFRRDVAAEALTYLFDIPSTAEVYLQRPTVGIPESGSGGKGRRGSQPRVLSGDRPVSVQTLRNDPQSVYQRVELRHTERGLLTAQCAARRVWTVTPEGGILEEWLLITVRNSGEVKFSVSNAPVTTSCEELGRWRCQRYFVERVFQDAKSEAGWDELIARKYRAWVHHAALDALALWFIAETKWEFARQYPRDPALKEELEVVVLPALSMANVREMLRAVLPRQQLSPEQATAVVLRHLTQRSRSTRSRLKAQSRGRSP